MDLPPEAIAAREKAFKIKPQGEGGRCLWCNADHRFGPDWWPRAEREAHVVAVAAARKADFLDRSSTVKGAHGYASSINDDFDPDDDSTLSDLA